MIIEETLLVWTSVVVLDRNETVDSTSSNEWQTAFADNCEFTPVSIEIATICKKKLT